MKSHPLDSESNSHGVKSLQVVGLWLKSAREQNGESLDNVAKITRIGKNYLEAIEEGAAAKLPSSAYTRGFIRLYAAHLGLPPDEALAMMNGQIADGPHHELQATLSLPGAKPLSIQQAGGPGRRKILYFLIICIVALAAIIATLVTGNRPKRSSPGRQTVAAIPFAAVTAPAAAVPAGPLKSDVQPAATVLLPGNGEVTTPETGIVLRLKAVSAGRLHITIDGSVSQEYDLVAGDLVEWKAEKMFLLDLENARSIEGELDGKPLKPFGEAGKAAHLIIRQNGVQQD